MSCIDITCVSINAAQNNMNFGLDSLVDILYLLCLAVLFIYNTFY